MVSLQHSWASIICCTVLLLSSLQQLSAHAPHQSHQPSASYIDAYGQHSSLAARLAQLIEAEEPLLPGDVARLAAAVK